MADRAFGARLGFGDYDSKGFRLWLFRGAPLGRKTGFYLDEFGLDLHLGPQRGPLQ